MSAVAVSASTVSLKDIDLGENTRELDPEHVKALAASIALRGLIVPLLVTRNGERFTLIAGYHRYAACLSLGLDEVEVTLREQEGTSADSAAENVVRKALTPLEEARAVKHMLDEGYTLDGAATVLGWSRKLVCARAKILELPESAQRLIGSGRAAGPSARHARDGSPAVSPSLCEAALGADRDRERSTATAREQPGLGDRPRGAREPREGVRRLLSTLSSRDVAGASARKEGDGRPTRRRRSFTGSSTGTHTGRRRSASPTPRFDQARAAGRADRVRARHADHHRPRAAA